MFDLQRENKKSIRDAFISVYDQSFHNVYGFIFARVGSSAAAEEITQETFAAVWAHLNGFEKRSKDTTWVIAIARHKIADYYRREIRRSRHEETPEEWENLNSDEDIEKLIIDGETKKHVETALNGLCPLYRFALAMKYMDGYSIKEIARMMGKTAKAVDGILQRAKAGFIKQYGNIEGV